MAGWAIRHLPMNLLINIKNLNNWKYQFLKLAAM